jgi:hypothetical protein
LEKKEPDGQFRVAVFVSNLEFALHSSWRKLPLEIAITVHKLRGENNSMKDTTGYFKNAKSGPVENFSRTLKL